MTTDKPSTFVPKLRFPEFRDDPNWDLRTLSSACDVNPSNNGLPESFVYIDLQSVKSGMLIEHKQITRNGAPSRAQRLLSCNDIIYQTVRPYQRNNFFFDISDGNEYVASTGYAQLRANECPEFLYQLLQTDSFVNSVLARCTGSNYPAINPSDLASICVILPRKPEQQKIADCLCSLDDLIAVEGRKLEGLRQHKQGLMQQLFPQRGETVPRLRFPEFLNGSTWDEQEIGDVCDLKAGDFIPASEIVEHADEGLFPCYGGNGFRGYVKSFTHEGRYVLIGRQGALCGNVNLYAGKFHATEHALVATPKAGVDTGWLFYALDVLNLNRFSIGQAQPGLSVTVLRDVGILVPTRDDEQRKIADCLGALDDLIAAEGRKLDSLRQHIKGLTQQLFPSFEAESQ